jgi:hypothetical protein
VQLWLLFTCHFSSLATCFGQTGQKNLLLTVKVLCFSYVVALDYVWLYGLTISFNFGVLELHVFVLWFCLICWLWLSLSVFAGVGVFFCVFYTPEDDQLGQNV